jgi:hypothetical protein
MRRFKGVIDWSQGKLGHALDRAFSIGQSQRYKKTLKMLISGSQKSGRLLTPKDLQGHIFLSVVDTYENIDLNRGSFNDITGRIRVSRADVLQGRTAVILIFGQSNGANSGDTPYIPRNRVFNLNVFDGQCYAARDPLLGATESRGNFATRMADMLIEQNYLDTIVLVPISVGGSRIEEWTTGGARHRRLQIAIKRVIDQELVFTHVLWHQGESNAGDDADAHLYDACFMNIHLALRSYGVAAPIYVAQATLCNSPPNEVIRSAHGSLAGPDTDTIGAGDRYDGCHMAQSGLIKHARLWVETLTATKPPSGR